MARNLTQEDVINDNIDSYEIRFQIEHLIHTITEDTRFKIHDAAKNPQGIPQAYYDINNRSYDDQLKLIVPQVVSKVIEIVNSQED